ncbi:hypothetical protein C7H85_04945 [Zobellella endophytica]|uniref:Type II secretion system protein GspF domain-containing protein n=1 Tax=Zobellella endophytica TaxID=2116700 RepID=A0A2P7RD19_9GAMM|nr:type II secretion system F family protein [Zobellella endophytica]PSJ48134.1 hypothetical protein C7H85_04945 [Zobellella endophytica]
MEILAAILVLVVLAAGLLWYRARRQLRQQALAHLDRALQDSYHQRLWYRGRSFWLQAKRPGRRLNELALLLRRAGMAGSHQQLRFLCVAGGGCLLLILMGAGGMFFFSTLPPARVLLLVLVLASTSGYGVVIGLRLRVQRRRARLDEELLLVLQVMRILWEVGMSMESLLRVLTRELAQMAPESTRELAILLARIEAGEDREQTLLELAAIVPSDGWQDMLRLLAQVSASGGGMSEALQRLGRLLQDRRRTQLQEKVSKLSGRMSAVMMIFLFPALLIVLAGPGFLALTRALGNMG